MSDPIHDRARPSRRIPSGIFILTAGHDGQTTGMLASWVQQAGFEPLMITVAVQDRYVAEWIAASGRFTLNQVAAGDKTLLKHFGKGFGPDEFAFEGIALRDASPEGPVLAEALAYLEVEVESSVDGGDHRVFLGRVVGGGKLRDEAEPMVHVRRSGLHY